MKVFPLLFLAILLLPINTKAQTLGDSDGDGINDLYEMQIYYTDPDKADTDGDGFNDGLEIKYKYSPHQGQGKTMMEVDSDKDLLNDAWELILGTDLMDSDTDNDGYADGIEVNAGYDPLDVRPLQINKLIKVNLAEQRLSYYFGDKLLDNFLISSGLSYTPTPVGEFTILDKVPVKHYGGVGFDYPNTKWNLHFTTQKLRYYIHGAYWHNNFGQPMSHGCINVDYKNMEPLYQWAQVGTKFIVE